MERQIGNRASCPCCGYPTLRARNAFEVCCLCEWEDRDEAGGDVLVRARTSFWRCGRACPGPADGPARVGPAGVKQALAAALDELRRGPGPERRAELWAAVARYEAVLDTALRRRLTGPGSGIRRSHDP